MDDLTSSEAYSLLSSLIVPRPIAFVSTVSQDGVANLAPFSFFVAGGASPASLAFSTVLSSDGTEKDTLTNIRSTGEFVVNIVHRPLAEDMNRTSAALPFHVSEWDYITLDQLPSSVVRPMRVAGSLAQFECSLFTIVEHGDGPSAARYIVGEVKVFHVREDLWLGSKVDPANVRTIARMGGSDYLDTNLLEFFQLERPS